MIGASRAAAQARLPGLGHHHPRHTQTKSRPARASPRRSDLGSVLSAHAGAILACDFFTVDTVLLKTLYVLVFMEIHSRRMLYASCTAHPNSA